LCSNNMAEYQALILGLHMAMELGLKDLDIYGDSQLVISQLLGEYEVKKEDLIPHHRYATKFLEKLDTVMLNHVPKSANKMADALAGLAATLALGAEETMSVPVCNRWVVALDVDEIEDEEVEEVDMIIVHKIDQEDWRQPIIDYLSHQKLLSDPRHRMEIRRRAPRCILFNGTLFRRSFNDSWSRCIEDEEIMKAMEEAHAGICVAHQSAILLLELQIQSLRVAIQEGLTNDENDKLRLAELEALDEKRLRAQQKSECYQARLSSAFNKKVRPRSFQVGDIVLAVRRPIITSRKTGSKFTSKWDSPYVVQEVYTNGAYKIVDAKGLRVGPINDKFLKRYYS
ncbi:hypothetical protein SOVF_159130, partial [Spinacia oleracea]